MSGFACFGEVAVFVFGASPCGAVWCVAEVPVVRVYGFGWRFAPGVGAHDAFAVVEYALP